MNPNPTIAPFSVIDLSFRTAPALCLLRNALRSGASGASTRERLASPHGPHAKKRAFNRKVTAGKGPGPRVYSGHAHAGVLDLPRFVAHRGRHLAVHVGAAEAGLVRQRDAAGPYARRVVAAPGQCGAGEVPRFRFRAHRPVR